MAYRYSHLRLIRSVRSHTRILNEAEQVADEDEAGNAGRDVVDLPDTGLPAIESATGKKRGRRPPPENLPRERVEYDLPDDQKDWPCSRGRMHRMGETVTEQLHVEVKAKVLQNVRLKYACRHCDRTGITTPVVTASMPVQPLPGSIATASTLAFALVHKYVDGTPLYRLAQAFERAGVPVSRGALGHWVIGSSERHLHRIYDALKLRLRSQTLIHGDEKTVQVLKEKDRLATSTSYMWAYRSAEDSDEPIVLLDYQPGRGQIYPQAFLGDYRGILMSDGYSAWRTLEGATHLGCMAHSRRRLSMPSRRKRKAAERPSRRSGSSSSSTGLKGRRAAECRATAIRRPTAFAAFASSTACPSSTLSSNGLDRFVAVCRAVECQARSDAEGELALLKEMRIVQALAVEACSGQILPQLNSMTH